MKTFFAIIFGAAMINAAGAEEAHSNPVVPLPRLRLDPARHTAIADRKEPEKSESSDAVVSMSPFIVRSTRIEASEAEQDRLPAGPISVLSGGWIYRKDSHSTHTEVGVWPYRNMLWKTDRFKSDLKHVGTEFVRISW